MSTAVAPRAKDLSVKANKLVAKARELIHEGNARRIIIKNADGVTLIEVPLTIGVVGGVLEPVWVALGALAALTAHYRIAVEKVEPRDVTRAGPTARHFSHREDV